MGQVYFKLMRLGTFQTIEKRPAIEYHKTRPHKVKDFAAFTKLNNAKCVSIEPELTCGGVAAYAQKLLEEVSAPREVA